jgi:hypothetical protein
MASGRYSIKRYPVFIAWSWLNDPGIEWTCIGQEHAQILGVPTLRGTSSLC